MTESAVEAIRVPANADFCYRCGECCNEPHFILWGNCENLKECIGFHGDSHLFFYQVPMCEYCFYQKLRLDTTPDKYGLLSVIKTK